MTRRWRTRSAGVGVVLALVGCSNRDGDFERIADDGKNTVVSDEGDWEIEVRDSGCVRIHRGEQRSRCVGADVSAGISVARLEAGDGTYVLVIWGRPASPGLLATSAGEQEVVPVPIGPGVVAEGSGRTLIGVQVGAVFVPDGVEVWGIQLIDGDGDLISAESLLD